MMDMEMDENPTQAQGPVLIKVEKIEFFDDDGADKKFEPVKRGRTRSLTKKSGEKVDIKAKLERSRQSARECRARKKLRYQYLEEIIAETEKSILLLRRELEAMKSWAKEMEEGRLPEHLIQYRTACVDKKLTFPFQLQEHHHNQLAQQQLQQQQQQQQNLSSSTSSTAATAWTSGGICISPSSGVSFLSHSPSEQLSPQMSSSSAGAYSISPS